MYTYDSHIIPGKSFPLGATVFPHGVNFSVYAKYATSVELLLFDDIDDTKPSRCIRLDPKRDRTFHYWHVFIQGLKEGQVYAYRVYGPSSPSEGHRFDGAKVLIDPYAHAVAFPEKYDPVAACRPGDNCIHAAKAVVVDRRNYDWEDDIPINRPYSETVIYELHVGGFTRHASSGVKKAKRGTYSGLVEKIPYLKELGITAVELMPVQQFDDHVIQDGLSNYWGYSPMAFFAPHAGYSTSDDPLDVVREFKDMVKEFHKAGIEVILDVVFNHTNEGDQNGPCMSLRGFANRSYYTLEQDKQYYSNYSGCGNTINANHSVVRRMILDCLRYWVADMHVDGFRFDLASIFSRDEYGRPLESPPILWDIETDPILAGAKIIAEPWDAGGLYQVGSFVGHRWAEWNGRFRDDIRSFVKGEPGYVRHLASRLTGSADLFSRPGWEPNRSINFVTCHDGFTLYDQVSYNEKHNDANGENNRDGHNDNRSWNCGIEGPSDDPKIVKLRRQQMKNFFTLLMLSEGTPMLSMGDEVARSQGGNNNAYCQDNDISWMNWKMLDKEKDMYHFVSKLIAFYKSMQVFQLDNFWAKPVTSVHPHLCWHGQRLGSPDWGDNSHSLAFTLDYPETGDHLHVMINSYWKALEFEVPPVHTGHKWYRVLDTSKESPNDFLDLEHAEELENTCYPVESRSIVVVRAMKDPDLEVEFT